MIQTIGKEKIEGQFVVFALGEEKYGVQISSVKEIVKWSKTTQLPQMSEVLAGVIKLRDQVIPVISLRKKFGWPEADDLADTRIIILEIDSTLIGINVDDVDSVVHVPSSAVEFPIGLMDQTSMICGIAKLPDLLLILLNVERLFSRSMLEELAAEDNET
ncbi:MAG: chemotaxis protein CheW [Limnochordia bacterium]|jgi:purine-binding chemotaxis protein CheW|nr:chemotaxis protein CheW [Limnochordia bacterium]